MFRFKCTNSSMLSLHPHSLVIPVFLTLPSQFRWEKGKSYFRTPIELFRNQVLLLEVVLENSVRLQEA